MFFNITSDYDQQIIQEQNRVIKTKNTQTKKYRIIQTLLMISGIVLICLGGFGVLSAGIFTGLAIGLGSFFVSSVLASIFIGKSGYGSVVLPLSSNVNAMYNERNMATDKAMEINFYSSIAIALIGIALITCGAFGVIELGMACSIGIPILLVALSGIIQNTMTLQRKIISSMSRLSDFYIDFLHNRDENVVLLGSILTCLALGVMTLLGSLNLMFAVGLMAPLIVGSVVFKIAQVVIEERFAKLRREQFDKLDYLFDRELQLREPNLNLNENNQENNRPPIQNNLNEVKELQNPPGSTQGQTPGGN
ncbi:MAG: hypothetical protein IJU86_03825 [Firmicutes bacterium]|nr:hypothetical protein [Bacillota bacterium]